MKKYFKLTSEDAVPYFFARHDGTLESILPEEIRRNPGNLNKIRNEVSVSITLPTHQIFPDTENDKIVLKNLIVRAGEELKPLVDKKTYTAIMENLEEAQRSIDYRRSLDGLVMYANENFSSFIKLPVRLEEKVLIGPFFDVRPLYKAMQQNEHYYILTISRQKIRLLEAFNDWLIEETDNSDFPFENTSYFTKDPTKLMQDVFTENLIKEYFNVADKRLRKYLLENQLPVILAGDVKTVSYFKEMMDDGRLVIAQVSGNYDNTPTHEVVKTVSSVIGQYRKQKNEQYAEEIKKAQSQNLLTTDLEEIHVLASSGNADVLYIGNHYSLKGEIDEHSLNLNIKTTNNRQEEIVLAFIDKVVATGGRIMFLEDELLKDYQGIVLRRRF